MQIILIQLFWLSFSLIGLLWVILLRKRNYFSAFTSLIIASPLLFQLFTCTLIGFSSFIIPSVLFYIFQLPLTGLCFVYLFLLFLSFVIVFKNARALKNKLAAVTKNYDHNRLLYVIVWLVLVLDYALSLWVGGNFTGDAPLHIAKIQQIYSGGHLTLADPFVGYNGILDLRYSANIFYALAALACKLLHVGAITVWLYSYAFFRFLTWLSLFALSREYLPEDKAEWAYYVLIFAPLMYNGYFFTNSEVPHSIVLIFISAMLIGLKKLFQTGSAALFLIAVSLIATTHAIASLESICFLVFLALILIILKSVSKRQLMILAAAGVILIIPVIANIAQPSRSTDYADTQNYGYGLHPTGLKANKVGPIVYTTPVLTATPRRYSPFDTIFLIGCLIALPYLYLARRVKKYLYKIIILSLCITMGLIILNIVYVSLLGSIYLVVRSSNLKSKTLVILATMFYAIMAYNPLVVTAIYHKIPLWFVARFEDFNTISYITVVIGVLAAIEYLIHYINLPTKKSHAYFVLASIIIVVLGLKYGDYPLFTLSYDSLKQQHIANTKQYKEMQDLQVFNTYTAKQIVFTTDSNITSYLGAVSDGGGIGLIENQQSNQQQNLTQRYNCQLKLSDDLDQDDLSLAKVQVLVLVKGLSPLQQAKGLTFLKYEGKIGQDYIYKVRPANSVRNPDINSVCNIKYGQ
jgi:hypothetical protein